MLDSMQSDSINSLRDQPLATHLIPGFSIVIHVVDFIFTTIHPSGLSTSCHLVPVEFSPLHLRLGCFMEYVSQMGLFSGAESSPLTPCSPLLLLQHSACDYWAICPQSVDAYNS